MNTLAPFGWVTQALRLVPGPLLRQLDAWSHRRALGRQLQRQQAWLARNAPMPVEQPIAYKLKPWRD